jgi:superfamily II DNA or RNA helicase
MIQSKLSQYRSLFKKYSTNFEYFEQYKANHRLHQKEALEAIKTSNIGQVLSPCGTGKTRIQISVHIQDMINKSSNNEYGVYLIASHRLTLNVQLFDQLIDVCVNTGLPFNILFVGSYHCDFSKYYEKYMRLGFTKETCNCLATTDRKEIDNFISQSKDRHVIIVSTYHSFDQLKNIPKIDICTYDEAHNTIERDFKQNILQVKPNIKREYFFTATRKIHGEDDGMNDKTFYGEVLYDAFPNLMLRSGEICCPKIHIIDSENNKDETSIVDIHMLIKNIIEGFEKHREFIKEKSMEPDKINPTMLISCSGIKEMMNIYNHNEFKSYIEKNNIKALAISSDGCWFNYESCSKQSFLKNLNAIKDTEEAIIFNVDMLTEGIDLPSITGVMPLRNMSNTKLIQLLGRCLRLHREDRQNLYAELIDPCKYFLYIKPYGWLIIPRHLATLTEYKTMLDTVKLVINEYESLAEEIVVQEQFIDPNYQELDSIIEYPLNGKKDFNLKHESMDIISDINIEKFRDALLKNGKIQYLTNMLNNHEIKK